MKKIGIICLISALIISLTGCGKTQQAPSTQQAVATQSAGKPEYTLKLACSATAESASGKAGAKYKELIEKNSNGRIQVGYFPNSQLGSDKDIIESVLSGNIQIGFMTTAPQVNYIPQLGVFDLPGAFVDVPSAYKVLSGPFKDKIAQYYDKAGFKLELFVPVGFREMSSSKPVRKFEDFKGIKIRTMDNPYHIAYWKALGAVPTSIAFSELYVALQQGVVQAQENPVDTIVTSKFPEVQKYIINTNHIMFISTSIVNKKLYDSMPADLQKVMDDSSKQAGEYYMQISSDLDKAGYQACKDKGLEIINLPAEDMKKMQDAAKPVYDMIRSKVGDDLVNSLLKDIDAQKK